MKRIYSIIVLALIILTSTISTSVLAQNEEIDIGKKSIDIGIDPATFNNGQKDNNLGSANFSTEPNILKKDVELPEGIYLGPYSQSSLFQYNHKGGNLKFNSTFNFTFEDVMNGCSKFTVRIPLFYSSQIFKSITLNIYNSTNVLLYTKDIEQSQSFTDIGDFGIYVDIFEMIQPGIVYKFEVDCEINDGRSGNTFLTVENYQISDSTEINFYKLGDPLDTWHGFQALTLIPTIYDFNEVMEGIFPAWAFIFEQGVGKNGMYGMPLDFSNGQTLEYTPIIPNKSIVNNTNLSIYLPFRQRGASRVDWDIEMSIDLASDLQWKNPVGGALTPTLNFQITDTENFLMFSSPFYLVTVDFGVVFPTDMTITLKPDKNITLLNQFDESQTLSKYKTIDGLSFDMDYFLIPEFTIGQWAKVTPSRYFTSYNFGWGTGFRFPGDSQIFFFLKGGTNIFLDVQISRFHTILTGQSFDIGLGPVQPFFDAISNISGNVNGFIDTQWEHILNFGNFIQSNFLSFKKFLIDVFTEIKNIVTNIGFGLSFSAPFIIFLLTANFIVGYQKPINERVLEKLEKIEQIEKNDKRKPGKDGEKI